jgi:predicted RNA-binding Zn-ribbon protein involved in translation (DUF1610 family)
VWGLWKENIPLARLIDSSSTLCWSAKWYGEDEVLFSSIMETSHKRMIKQIHKLMEEADVIIHYYGSRFDLPVLNREFLILGLAPPSPYKSIDLLTTVRRKFKFISNKLDYVCEKLKLGKKHETSFKLWVDCMNKDPEAWEVMKKYNIQDVLLLEKLYDKLKPWISNHPNIGLYREVGLVCPTCGSEHFHKRGYYHTSSYKYQRYQCTKCGSWFKGGANLGHKPTDKFTGIS